MPRVDGVLETSLYVADLERSRAFYCDLLGLEPLLETPRLVAIDAGRRSVLLLFSESGVGAIKDARGLVPGHGATGRAHVAFAIGADDLQVWRERLMAAGVALAGEYAWPRGGTSLYFEDPDGHVLELATPGLWSVY